MKIYPDLNKVMRAGHARRIREQHRAVPIIIWLGIALLVIIALSPLACADDINMDIIAQIESSGCINKVGDGGAALGCHQLHAGAVLDFNKAHGTTFKHTDVMNNDLSRIIASWYMNEEIPRLLKHYKLADTIENRLTAWNMGIGNVVKGKRADNYIHKYRSRL